MQAQLTKKVKRAFEEKAIKYVELWEKTHGRKVHKPKKGQGCDLISSGGYHIEVKSWKPSKIPNHIPVYESIFEYLKKKSWGKRAYYIYLVYDEKNPKLIRIPPCKQKWYPKKIRLLKKESMKDIVPINLENLSKEFH